MRTPEKMEVLAAMVSIIVLIPNWHDQKHKSILLSEITLTLYQIDKMFENVFNLKDTATLTCTFIFPNQPFDVGLSMQLVCQRSHLIPFA